MSPRLGCLAACKLVWRQGNAAGRDLYHARPGASNHTIIKGFAIDFDFFDSGRGIYIEADPCRVLCRSGRFFATRTSRHRRSCRAALVILDYDLIFCPATIRTLGWCSSHTVSPRMILCRVLPCASKLEEVSGIQESPSPHLQEYAEIGDQSICFRRAAVNRCADSRAPIAGTGFGCRFWQTVRRHYQMPAVTAIFPARQVC